MRVFKNILCLKLIKILERLLVRVNPFSIIMVDLQKIPFCTLVEEHFDTFALALIDTFRPSPCCTVPLARFCKPEI